MEEAEKKECGCDETCGPECECGCHDEGCECDCEECDCDCCNE